MIHPDTELRFINDSVGYGVFATAFIPEGTIVYAKDSLEIEVTEDQFAILPPLMQESVEKYSYIDQRGVRVVSWDIGKYVNHCCNCNTMSTGYGFEVAIRDIQSGEQITDEYGIFNLEYEIPLECSCMNCRGVVRPLDFELLHREWDKRIAVSVAKVFDVPQPLLGLIDDHTLAELQEYIAEPSRYKSVYSLKYHRLNGKEKLIPAELLMAK